MSPCKENRNKGSWLMMRKHKIPWHHKFPIPTEKILVPKRASAHWEYNHISTKNWIWLYFLQKGAKCEKKLGHYD